MARIRHLAARPSASLSATYGRRRMYDVRDYTSTDDMGAAINRAIAAAYADAFTYGKPGQVIIPPMNEAVTTPILPKTGVDVIGSGWGKTILRPQGGLAAFRYIQADGASSANYLSDILFADFEIDGSDQSGAYTSAIKGMYLLYLHRVKFDHLLIRDTGASGLGVDYLADCVIDDVTVNDCGRLGTTGVSPGASGIGIGTTSAWGLATDHYGLTISNCTTRGNKNHGLFFEMQSSLDHQQGCLVANHHSSGNGAHGIGDAGCSGLIVKGAHLKANGGAGFAAFEGSVANSSPGIRGMLSDIDAVSNGTHGIQIKATSVAGGDNYTIKNSRARNNSLHGIALTNGASAITGIVIQGCDAHSNVQAGIGVTTTGGSITDLTIANNRAYGNGTGGTNPYGIYIAPAITRLSLKGNRAYDPAGSPTQTFGLSLGGTLTDSDIQGNDFRFNVTGPVSGKAQIGAGTNLQPDNLGWTVNSGTPEGNVTASLGTQYRRTDGGAGTCFYVKETSLSSTGWVAK